MLNQRIYMIRWKYLLLFTADLYETTRHVVLARKGLIVSYKSVVQAVLLYMKKMEAAVFAAICAVFAQNFQNVEKNGREQQQTLLGKEGAYLDAIYFCPHHPHKGYEGEVPELKVECECRKPKPGMLLRAAEDLNIDLSKSYMVGDGENDVKAGIVA